LADSGDNWDSNPYLFAVRNGVIDLRTGELRAGRSDDRITMRSPVESEQSAKCERWEKFLTEIFGGDEELIGFVRRAVGYCLTGDTSEQCLFLAFGDGSNGKSTFLNIVGYILGDYAHNLPFSAFEVKKNSSIPNDVATLVGRRFVTAVETSESQRLNEARIKALTGGDRITARFLHAEYFTFQPAAKFWLAFNHKPRVTDDSHGFWRRIRLIPFTQTFDETRKDRQIESKLRSEAPGILAWAVAGCMEWQRQGLGTPQAVEDATREYRSENDVIAEFVDSCCVIDPAESALSGDLFSSYGHWAKSQGESWPLTQRGLTERITKLAGVRSDRVGKQRARGFSGIGLKNRKAEAPQ
jgi:putative DNA primase/helicase